MGTRVQDPGSAVLSTRTQPEPTQVVPTEIRTQEPDHAQNCPQLVAGQIAYQSASSYTSRLFAFLEARQRRWQCRRGAEQQREFFEGEARPGRRPRAPGHYRVHKHRGLRARHCSNVVGCHTHKVVGAAHALAPARLDPAASRLACARATVTASTATHATCSNSGDPQWDRGGTQ